MGYDHYPYVDRVTGGIRVKNYGVAYPYILLNDAGETQFWIQGGTSTRIMNGATSTSILDIIPAAGLTTVAGLRSTTSNLRLEANNVDGTPYVLLEGLGDISLITPGVVRFGTFAGTGDVACNGNIPIKDALGNARKLMTTA